MAIAIKFKHEWEYLFTGDKHSKNGMPGSFISIASDSMSWAASNAFRITNWAASSRKPPGATPAFLVQSQKYLQNSPVDANKLFRTLPVGTPHFDGALPITRQHFSCCFLNFIRLSQRQGQLNA